MSFAALKRLAYWGLSPRVLIAHARLLRVAGRLPKQRHTQSKPIRRIFFSFPYHSVGDLILSLTLLERTHALWPDAEIDVAVGASMADIVASIPYVHAVFRLSRSSVRQPILAAYAAIHRATRLFQEQIAPTQYDLALSPRWDSADSFFSAHLAFLTGAPVRCGYSSTCDGGTDRTDRFHTHVARGGVSEHESLRYARLLARCGLEPMEAVDANRPSESLRVLREIARKRCAEGLALRLPISSSYAVLSPGATNPRRMWPIDRFREVGQQLFLKYGLVTVVLGSEADNALCGKLSEDIGFGSFSLAGKTSPLQMIDVISAAALFVGNDSGPGHIAGGLGIETFTVSPFPLSSTVDHPNSMVRFRPIGPRVHLFQPVSPCAPCSPTCLMNIPHCILQISAQEVLEGIANTLEPIRVKRPEFSCD